MSFAAEREAVWGGAGLKSAYPASSTTPPAFAPPPPSSDAPHGHPPHHSLQGWPSAIRLPTTPGHHPHFPPPHHPAFHRQVFMADQGPPPPSSQGPASQGLSPRGGIVSPTPRYPSQGPPAPSKLELEMLRQQQAGGFWSPQPRPGSATFGSLGSPPLRGPTPGMGFHSPPLSAASAHQLGASLPPKFLAKQSPSVTPASAGLHPNHQHTQLSASLSGGGTGPGGLLSIQTTAGSTAVVSSASAGMESGSSPTSTTPSHQEPASSTSDHRPADDGPKEQLSNGGEGEVSTSRVSPANAPDNSSSSAATDTPTSLPDSDDKEGDKAEPTPVPTSQALDSSTQEAPLPTDSAQTMDTADSADASSTAQATLSAPQEAAPPPSTSVADDSAAGSDLAPTSALVMDVDPQVEPITPTSTPGPTPLPATPSSQESAQALLSLAQGPVTHQASMAPPTSQESAEMNAAAARDLQDKIAMEALRRVGGFLQQQSMPAASFQTSPHATVTRPPGLGPAPPSANSPLAPSFPGGAGFGRSPGLPGAFGPGANQPGGPGGQARAAYSCPICGFECNSKFHFNSHMNTHTDHQCTMCDYTARTEGRLKRHMEGHSEEDRARAGVNAQGERLSEAEKSAVAGSNRSSEGSQRTPDTPATSGSSGAGEASNQSGGAEPSPLERLQMQLEDTAPTSITQTIAATPEVAAPTRRSGGGSSKPKSYKCKQCEHVSQSKEESWRHNRLHIKPDKLLTCPQCEFVTEYKHHLEYHLRNHFGSKPFQCSKCHYSCVNKSMLNSHMKSHSQFYQFRCSDCTYATKYCHSLKLHLRKYNHRPATVVAADGTVLDPTQNLDLYGTRARARNSLKRESSSPSFGSPNSSHHGDAQNSPAGGLLGSSHGLGSPSAPPTMVPSMEPSISMGFPAMANTIATIGARLPTIPTIASTLQMQMKQALLQRQAELHHLAQQQGMGQGPQGPPGQLQPPMQQSASEPSLHPLKCRQCEFQAGSKEELDKHCLVHLAGAAGNGLLSQEQLSSLYEALSQRAQLAAAQAQAQGEQPGAGAPGEAQGPHSGPEVSDGASTEHSPSGGAHSRTPDMGDGSGGSSGSPISKGSGDEGSHGGSAPSGSSRRKGKARKLDSIAQRLQECKSEGHDEAGPTAAKMASSSIIPQRFVASAGPNGASGSASGSPAVLRNGALSLGAAPRAGGMDWEGAFVCPHCRMAFMHEVMYQIHMGFHGYDNPFRCNRCGHDSPDELALFMHIAQSKH